MFTKSALTTVVRDASRTGAGMASVALTIHNLLEDRFDTQIAVGIPPEHAVKNQQEAGASGSGFRRIPSDTMNGVVHIHGLWTPFEFRAYREARAREAKLVISPHGSLEPWAFRSKRLKKLPAWYLYQKAVLQKVDLLVASTKIEHDNFRELGLTAPIAILPVGVDVSDRSQAIADAPSLNRKKIVLFLSRLSEKKGIPDLLNAWHSIADRRGYQLHIHGYGSDSYRSFLEGRIRQLNLNDSVQLSGPLFADEKWRKFQELSIYVLPSYSENFGITVAEALLSGLPAITTTATPWSDIASRGMGWIVDNDVAQLRNALEIAISLDPDQMEPIRQRAAAYARQNFLWPPIADSYAETYKWLLDPRNSTPDWVSVVSCSGLRRRK